MHTVERDVIVGAPLERVYNQWTQFEEFPRFMDSVTEVTQLDDRHLRWGARILGRDASWEAEIDRQVPDAQIVWHTTEGRTMRGAVRFTAWNPGQTRLAVEVEYDVDGVEEAVADALGVVGREIQGGLEQFKEFVESRLAETGTWRGEIPDEHPADLRERAEEQQREPGISAAPGGQPVVDPRTGRISY
ncbi:MAG: SRPBCC family protein [Dehalococcoidia bacterium]